jgi:hypothetical protein
MQEEQIVGSVVQDLHFEMSESHGIHFNEDSR